MRNREKSRASDRAYYWRHRDEFAFKERYRIKAERYRKENPEKFKSNLRAAYRKRMQRDSVGLLGRIKRWKKENPHKVAADDIRRKTQRRLASPKWADERSIKALYLGAREISQKSGVSHHVDHIVPLRHPLVCGLHWEGNLQILDARSNVRKQNRHWPDMP